MAKAGRPLRFKTVEELEKAIQGYFDSCFELIPIKKKGKKGKKGKTEYRRVQVKPFLITGLALHLNTSRQTLLEYEGEVEGREKKDPRFADAIKKAKLIVENYVETQLFGKNVVGPIFNLKNNFRWKDKTEVELPGAKVLILD